MGSFLKGYAAFRWSKKKLQETKSFIFMEAMRKPASKMKPKKNNQVHDNSNNNSIFSNRKLKASQREEEEEEEEEEEAAAAAAAVVAFPQNEEDNYQFDPHNDYAQVLEEARNHLPRQSNRNEEDQTLWLEDHLEVYRELEIQFRNTTKMSKYWKHLLFWQRLPCPQKDVSIIFSTPQHPCFRESYNDVSCNTKKSKQKQHKILNPSNNISRYGKGNSGPLYTDGLPLAPSNNRRTKKSHSGPLTSFLSISFDKDSLDISPYQPLHQPPPPSPLYCC